MKKLFLLLVITITLSCTAHATKKLIWATSSFGHSIGVADLNGSNMNNTYFYEESTGLTDVEYDPVTDYFYTCSDDYFTGIKRVSADGLSSTILVNTSSYNTCLSIYNNKIYYTVGDIGVVDIDGSNDNGSLITGQFAGGIHVVNNYIYFISGARYIKRADLDGNNIITIFDFGASEPSLRRLYVDITHSYIYFSNYSSYGFGRIDISGANLTQISDVADAYGIFVDEANSLVYMGRNNNTNAIQTSDLNGGSLTTLVATANHPWSLEIADVELPIDNPTSFAAAVESTSEIDLSWVLNGSSDPVLVAYNTANSFGLPSGNSYTATPGTNSISGGGTVVYVGSNLSLNHTGLAPNTRYYYKIWSKTPGDSYSSGVTSNEWTYANVPTAPTVDAPTATTLNVAINANSNPAGTEFAIYETTSTLFVQANGTLGESAVWQTESAWEVNAGTTAKTVIGLSAGTEYTFEVKARNGNNTETAYGTSASGTPVSAPSVDYPTSGSPWAETQPAGALDKNWYSVSASSDGNTVLACVYGGRLYKSSDGGTNWAETQPVGDINLNWITVSVSGDGNTMLAGVNAGRLYKSTDGGTNWTETQPYGDMVRNWRSLSISSDGSTMIAGASTQGLFVSTNAGTTWNLNPTGIPLGIGSGSVSVSNDGAKMLVAAQLGSLYTSIDGGANWTETPPAPGFGGLRFGSVSGDGSTMIAGYSSYRLFKSIDDGASWTETRPAGDVDKSWQTVSVSSNGNTILAGVNGGRLYKSIDGGTNWTETQPAGDVNKSWQALSVSSDGSKILAAVFSGRLYQISTQQSTATDITTTTATGNGTISNLNAGGNATNRGVIYYAYTNTDKVIGDAGVTNIDEDGTPNFGTGDFTASLTGLTPNTHYNLRAHATNDIGIGYSDRSDFWTLANVPDAPTVDAPTSATLNVAINVSSNPASTEYAIQETGSTNYVLANGTLGAGPIWQTESAWEVDAGTTAKTVTGLSAGTSYTFKVMARNGNSITTAYGSTASASTMQTEPTNHATSFNYENQTISSVDITWTDAVGGTLPQYYIIKASTDGYDDIVDPIDGIAENDALLVKNTDHIGEPQSVTFSGLASGTNYYFKIYPYRGTGNIINYKTDGSVPQVVCSTLVAYPTAQASNLYFSNVTRTGMTLNWANGDGAKRLAMAKLSSISAAPLADAQSYTANAAYGSGSSINGGYCVYNGVGSSVPVTGLTKYKLYYFRVFEYNEPTPGATLYLQTTNSSNPSSRWTLRKDGDDPSLNTGSAFSIYPNPTTDLINYTFELPESVIVTTELYTSDGRLVKSVNHGILLSGEQKLSLNVNDLTNGVYTLQIRIGEEMIVGIVEIIR